MRQEEGGHSRDTLHLVATLAEEEQEADAAQEECHPCTAGGNQQQPTCLPHCSASTSRMKTT